MELFILIFTALLSLIALLLSVLALSGSWLVLLAALIAKLSVGAPAWGSIVIFTLLCIASEIFEALAGFIGVQKRGGSALAGVAALLGGLIGATMGTALLPVIGTLAGMIIGSFAAAFSTEWLRLRHHGKAAHIAWGTVISRLAVLFVKTGLTLGMSIWLFIELLHQSG